MSDDDDRLTPAADTTTPEDIQTSPPSNPEPDGDDVAKGEDKLDGTLPY